MCHWSTPTFENSCGCTALDMPEWREATKQVGRRAQQPSHAACFSENLKCWGAWDTTCRHKAKDITPSIAWRREVWKEEALDNLPWKDGVHKGEPSSIRRTLQHWGNFGETGWSTYGLSLACKYHVELNWTNSKVSYFTLVFAIIKYHVELNWTNHNVSYFTLVFAIISLYCYNHGHLWATDELSMSETGLAGYL